MLYKRWDFHIHLKSMKWGPRKKPLQGRIIPFKILFTYIHIKYVCNYIYSLLVFWNGITGVLILLTIIEIPFSPRNSKKTLLDSCYILNLQCCHVLSEKTTISSFFNFFRWAGGIVKENGWQQKHIEVFQVNSVWFKIKANCFQMCI